MDLAKALISVLLFQLWTMEAGAVPVAPVSAPSTAELQQTPMKDGRRIWKFFNPVSWLPPFYFQMGNRQYPQRPSYASTDTYYGYGHGGGGYEGYGGGGMGYAGKQEKEEKKEKKEKKPPKEPEPEKPKEMEHDDHPIYNYYNVQNINSYYSSHTGSDCGCEYKRNCDCDYEDAEYEYVDR